MSDQHDEPEVPLLLVVLAAIIGAFAFAAGYVISSGMAMTYLQRMLA